MINDLYLNNFLLDEKASENILTYDNAYKLPYGAKSLHVMFGKVDGCIRKYDRTKGLGLFHSDEKQIIFHRIKYLIMLKLIITI